jgi:uncharacterized DUF497 family protein
VDYGISSLEKDHKQASNYKCNLSVTMKYEWDEVKRQSNIKQHGVDFIDVLPLFNNLSSKKIEDNRRDYGEVRYILLGEINKRLFQVAYTYRDSHIRIISARKGNKREMRIFENAQ